MDAIKYILRCADVNMKILFTINDEYVVGMDMDKNILYTPVYFN